MTSPATSSTGTSSICPGAALAEELGIDRHVERVGGVVAVEADGALNLLPVRTGLVLFDDKLVAVQAVGDAARDGLDLRHVGGAAIALGRADADEQDLPGLQSILDRLGHREAALRQVLAQEPITEGLEERHLAGGDLLRLRRVVVGAHDFPAQLCEAERSG
jgi:hypothetical protein